MQEKVGMMSKVVKTCNEPFDCTKAISSGMLSVCACLDWEAQKATMLPGFSSNLLFCAVQLGMPYDKPQDDGFFPLKALKGHLVARKPGLPQCCPSLLIVILKGRPRLGEASLQSLIHQDNC